MSMACRRRADEVAADPAYTYYDTASAPETGRVTEYDWRRPQPSAPPAAWDVDAAHHHHEWQSGGAAHGAVGGLRRMLGGAAEGSANMQVYVNTLHIHMHQHAGGGATSTAHGGVLISEEAPQIEQVAHFQPNDPPFHSAMSAQGVDFGRKLISRRYRAQKHVNAQYRMIIYTQCPSTAQAISHAVTLNLSHKRSKHVIFLFDCNLVDELPDSKWPSTIHLTQIESLIRDLGPGYEYHRRKVKKGRFSFYFYVVKQFGVRFSERGHRAWSSLFQWANSDATVDLNAGSDFSLSQVIVQVVSIGLGVVGAL